MRLARITAAAIAAAALALPAFAHDWYPQECCSGQDCEPIDESKITETAEGWHIKACSAIRPACIEGFIKRGTERPSQDARYHLCFTQQAIICFFVPLNA